MNDNQESTKDKIACAQNNFKARYGLEPNTIVLPQALVDILTNHAGLSAWKAMPQFRLELERIENMKVLIGEPAFTVLRLEESKDE